MKKLLLLAMAIVPLALSVGPVHSAVFDNPGNINAVDVSQFNKTNAEINAMNAYDKYSYGLNMSIAGSRLSANNDGANEGTQSSAEYDAYDTGIAMDERGREIMNAAGGRAASGHGSSSFGGIASALTGGLAGGGDFDITSVLSGGIITDDGFNATSILSGGLLNEEQVGDLDIQSLLSGGLITENGFDITSVLSGGLLNGNSEGLSGFVDPLGLLQSNGFGSFTSGAQGEIMSLDSEEGQALVDRMNEMLDAFYTSGGTNTSGTDTSSGVGIYGPTGTDDPSQCKLSTHEMVNGWCLEGCPKQYRMVNGDCALGPTSTACDLMTHEVVSGVCLIKCSKYDRLEDGGCTNPQPPGCNPISEEELDGRCVQRCDPGTRSEMGSCWKKYQPHHPLYEGDNPYPPTDTDTTGSTEESNISGYEETTLGKPVESSLVTPVLDPIPPGMPSSWTDNTSELEAAITQNIATMDQVRSELEATMTQLVNARLDNAATDQYIEKSRLLELQLEELQQEVDALQSR